MLTFAVHTYKGWGMAIVVLFACAALLPSEALAASLAKPPNHLGLVGYWNFDDGAGTHATDLSGNQNHGTLTGPPSWVTGVRGKALNFQFADDDVNLGSDASVDNISPLSVCAWVYPTSYDGGAFPTLVQKTSDGSNGWVLYLMNTGSFGFWNNLQDYREAATTGVGLNEWTHICATWNGLNGIAGIVLYVDGQSVTSSGAAASGSANDAARTLRIGSGGFSHFFMGRIDDLRIYRRQLSAAEIAGITQMRVAKMGVSSATLQQGTPFTTGLVGHWTFDGADTTTTIADKSGSGNTGYYIGRATSTAKIAGKLGQALDFNGSNTYVRAGSGTSLDNLSPMSVCAWVNVRGLQYTYPIIVDKSSNGFDGWNFYFTNEVDEGFGFYSNLQDGKEYYFDIPRNTWHHLCATWDGTDGAGGISLYLNGVSVSSATYVVTGTSNDAANNLNIGAGSGATDQFHDGGLDDVRIYNRVLSSSEVLMLYNFGHGKILTN